MLLKTLMVCKCSMARDMRGSKTARSPQHGSHRAGSSQRRSLGKAPGTAPKLASGPDPFSARRHAGGGRPATAGPRPSTAVAGPDLLALRPATSKLGSRFEGGSVATDMQLRKRHPMGQAQPFGSAWPTLLDQDAAARASSYVLSPKVRHCKLLWYFGPTP